MKHCSLIMLALLCGCMTTEPAHSTHLQVRVTNDENEPIHGAKVFRGNNPLGDTNKLGIVSTPLHKKEGGRITLRVACPEKHQAIPTDQQQHSVRFLQSLTNGQKLQPVEAHFICMPETKRHVVVVQTTGAPALPIRLMGKSAGHTDSDGVAHLVVSGTPNEEVEITLDTSGAPDLLPQMPARRLRLPARRRVLLFEQKFNTRELPVRKKRSAGRHRGPVRL